MRLRCRGHLASISVAKVRLPPVGFWSYTRRDDELSRRRLSELKSLIEGELQAQLGQKVHIFQDVSTISHGARWEEETRRALDNSTFFIPILTPSYLQSQWCCKEARIFLERQQRLFQTYPDLPQTSRIFPIHYIDVTEAEAADESIHETLKALQWFDFVEMRHLGLDPPEVRKSVSRFATSLCHLLRIRVEAAAPLPAPAFAPPPIAAGAAARAAPPAPASMPEVQEAQPAMPEAPGGPTGTDDAKVIIGVIVGVFFLLLLVMIVVVVSSGGDDDSDDAIEFAANDVMMTDANMTMEMSNMAGDVNAVDAVMNMSTPADNALMSGDTAGNTVGTAAPGLLVNNECPRQVRLRLVYRTSSGWEQSSAQPWTINGGARTRLIEGPGNPVRPSSEVVFFQAETTDGRSTWTGDQDVSFGGRGYEMRRYVAARDADGNYVVDLNCDGPRDDSVNSM